MEGRFAPMIGSSGPPITTFEGRQVCCLEYAFINSEEISMVASDSGFKDNFMLIKRVS
jgi:hypothetical protein